MRHEWGSDFFDERHGEPARECRTCGVTFYPTARLNRYNVRLGQSSLWFYYSPKCRGEGGVKKGISQDLRCLERADKAIRATSRGMRRAAVEFLWNKYITHGWRREIEEDEAAKKAAGSKR